MQKKETKEKPKERMGLDSGEDGSFSSPRRLGHIFSLHFSELKNNNRKEKCCYENMRQNFQLPGFINS